MKKNLTLLFINLLLVYSQYAQTYVDNGGVLECTGLGITSEGIYDALILNGIGTGHYKEVGTVNKSTYVFNAPIRIGNAANSGSNSVWDCSNEHIKIDADSFQIYGSVLQGNLNNGLSENGGSFSVVVPADDDFKLYDNGIFSAYGSAIYARHRIRLSDDCKFEAIDCEFQPEDGVTVFDTGSEPGSNCVINYDRSRVHHTEAVGIKLYADNNTNTFSLNETKVEGCTYAFQVGEAANLAPILKDVEINSCVFHLVPNKGDSNVIFVNPDFTTLRTAIADANDITTIAFRYSAKVLDAANIPIQNARCYYIDGNSDIVLNNTLTDSAGNITGLFNYDGEACLQNSTYEENIKTDRQNHTKAFASYLHNLKSESLIISKDISESIILSTDMIITEPSKAITDAYTEIETPAKFYDRAKAFLVDNFTGETESIITRNDDTIDAKGYNVVIDATAVTPFAFDGTTITIKANVFIGNILTSSSATITAINGAKLEGGYFDSTGLNKFVNLKWNQTSTNDVYIVNKDDSSNITPTPLGAEAVNFYKGHFLVPTPTPTNGIEVQINLLSSTIDLYKEVIPVDVINFVRLDINLVDIGTELNQHKIIEISQRLLVKITAINSALQNSNTANSPIMNTVHTTSPFINNGTLANQEEMLKLLNLLLSKVTTAREALKND